MSPEQKENPSKMTFASDIYSLGIIAYELAMGKLSYGVIHLSLLPRELRKIIEKALAVSVQERYQDALGLITDLSQYLKSGGLEKDRPGSDQVKEIFETVQTASQALSPASFPNWPQFDFGLVKYRSSEQVGSYFDFFKFPDNTFGILIAETGEGGIEGAVHIANLRGMARTFIQDKTANGTETFRSLGFVTAMHRMVKQDPIRERYNFSFLRLSPLTDQLAFVSCGPLGALLHVPQGSNNPRKLLNQNPQLGADSTAEFVETDDNWQVGDALILHSLDPSLEPILLEALAESTLLSPQGQAEAMLKKAAANPAFAFQKNPKVLIVIHRIG
jgi:serine/threonine protein kinase